MEKEKIILELIELEDLIKITTDKKELKRLKRRYTSFNNKLRKYYEKQGYSKSDIEDTLMYKTMHEKIIEI